jgi:DNA-directed RNA polymerase specialized sigma24 family protein
MDELDRHLKDLVEVAKQHLPGSRGRIAAVTRLLAAIERSRKLYCRGRHDYPPEVYHDAMQEVRAYIFRLIDRYDPSGAQMMTLVNQKLNNQFKDAIQKFKKERSQDISLSQEISENDGDTSRTLENVFRAEEEIYLSDQLRQIIEDDPENTFQEKCIKGRPEANFRAVALHMLDHHNMRDLAKIWGIPEQTLYSFFRRACQSLKPLITQYLREI